LVQAAAAELEGEKAEAEKTKASVDVAIANLRADKAEFEAKVAEETAKLIEKGAGLTLKSADVKIAAAEAGVVIDEASGAVDGVSALEQTNRVDTILAEFMSAADSAVGDMRAQAEDLYRKSERQPIGGTTRREGGRITADIEFDDGSSKSVSAVREKGGLRIVPPDNEQL